MVELRFLGSGDAFGSGGRLNTCFHVADAQGAFLVDCGASAMISIRRYDIAPNAIRAILISHLHGDHFGGLPFFLLDAQYVSRRSAPLVVAGPPGMRDRLTAALETFFPGSSKVDRAFTLDVRELDASERHEVAGIEVTPFLVQHPSDAPSYALRLKVDGKVICYSGDTEWTESLHAAAKDADLFITEAYMFDRPVRFHMAYAELVKHLPQIGARRVILTHMSAEMLARAGECDCELAEDGLAVTI